MTYSDHGCDVDVISEVAAPQSSVRLPGVELPTQNDSVHGDTLTNYKMALTLYRKKLHNGGPNGERSEDVLS